MKRKKIFIIISVVAAIAAIACFTCYKLDLFAHASYQDKYFMTYINEANAVVYYYGNLDPGREITLNYKKVTEFSAETIGDSANEYDYHEIVILDFDDSMDVTDDELMLIKDYCENKGYDLYYYGTAHFSSFKRCGFFTRIDSDNMGFMYNGSYWMGDKAGIEDYVNPYLVTGNWTSSEEKLFNHNDKHDVWSCVLVDVHLNITEAVEKAMNNDYN